MSGPGDKPDTPGATPDPAPDPAPDPTPNRGRDAAEKNLTVTPAKVAHAATRSERAAIPLTPGHTGEPMDLKGAEVPAKADADAAVKPDAAAGAKSEEEKVPDAAEDHPAKEKAPKEPEAKQPDDTPPKARGRRRGVIAWFFAGLGLAIAGLAGLASWNVWSEPHYVISPRLDALMQDFGGYVAAVAIFGLALIAVALLRGRAAFVTTAALLIMGAIVAVFTTVLLGIGAGIMCGREPVFTQGSPDRRLVVMAVRGRCGVTREFTYQVSVRELGPSIPRQTMIFQSFGRPAPSEVVFTKGRTISVLIKSTNAESAPRYTVTIDRRTFKPDKVWRFDVRTD